MDAGGVVVHREWFGGVVGGEGCVEAAAAFVQSTGTNRSPVPRIPSDPGPWSQRDLDVSGGAANGILLLRYSSLSASQRRSYSRGRTAEPSRIW